MQQRYTAKTVSCRRNDSRRPVIQRRCNERNEEHMVDFLGAYDHRKAEVIHGKIWDKVPASAWKNVK
ncbi:TPA: Hha/YmoA family nucleoid-associated regulatory protein [Escherichia coli]